MQHIDRLKRKHQGTSWNPGKEELKAAMDEFLKTGGKIKKIKKTEEPHHQYGFYRTTKR